MEAKQSLVGSHRAKYLNISPLLYYLAWRRYGNLSSCVSSQHAVLSWNMAFSLVRLGQSFVIPSNTRWSDPSAFHEKCKRMKKVPVYLLLFALYPVFALWTQNIQEVVFAQIGRVIVASLFLCLVVWLCLWLIVRDR